MILGIGSRNIAFSIHGYRNSEFTTSSIPTRTDCYGAWVRFGLGLGIYLITIRDRVRVRVRAYLREDQ
jgi:hypothetical protein